MLCSCRLGLPRRRSRHPSQSVNVGGTKDQGVRRVRRRDEGLSQGGRATEAHSPGSFELGWAERRTASERSKPRS